MRLATISCGTFPDMGGVGTRPMPASGHSWRDFIARLLMRCPYCQGIEDKVVDSRTADDSTAIRRRRECITCGSRYTTFERIEETSVVVLKRDGAREQFDSAKIQQGIEKALKNRPVDETAISTLVHEIEESFAGKAEISSEGIGEAILDRLAQLDEVAYLRFASVYLRFDGLTDFAREAGRLRRQSSVQTSNSQS